MSKQSDEQFYSLLNFLPIPVLVSEEVDLDQSGNQVNKIRFLNKEFMDIMSERMRNIFTSEYKIFEGKSILPFLHQMNIDFHSLDGLFN